jgi:hypothetical protein
VLTPTTVEAVNQRVRAQRQSRVCGGSEPRLLTALANPPPDGCAATAIARGPT